MNFVSLLLLSVFFITVCAVSLVPKCSVCVLEPLLTSPVKCPICTEKDLNGSRAAISNDIQEDFQLPSLNIFGQKGSRINWTTCYLETPPCNASYRYRSIDGSCNNLKHPTQGMRNAVFIRHLPAFYQDNRHAVALGSNGQPKPLARVLRTAFFPDKNNPDNATLITMQYGQVITHDITQTTASANNTATDCCSSPEINNTDICMPIFVPSNDYFYSQYNVTCISQVRNNITVIGDCNRNQPGQQYNNVTHILDASIVYGSTVERVQRIREFQGGRLRTQETEDDRAFMPNLPEDLAESTCYLQDVNESCYDAGDTRADLVPQLAALQNVFMREHNRLANGLQNLHPQWDDETVYQEARAIFIAEYQHITYREWLELHIGRGNMVKHKLYPRTSGYTEYKSDINIANINSFITAAFRAPHSGIQGFISLLNYQRRFVGEIALSDWMERPFIIQENNNYDEFLVGLVNQPMQIFEQFFTEQITNLLLRNTQPYGQDLMSIDIERGRDHGLAPYIHYLEICTGYHTDDFEDLYKYIPKEQVDKLEFFYDSVQDIDLMVGGQLENKVPGARLGPTFVCLLTEEFYRKKWSDRFWYEVKGQPHSFTRDQLTEIRRVTMSRLLCDNSDNITQIARNSFLSPSETNRIVSCNSIPGINLTRWS